MVFKVAYGIQLVKEHLETAACNQISKLLQDESNHKMTGIYHTHQLDTAIIST